MFRWNYETGRREYRTGAVTIMQYECGLLYRSGQFISVLSAGRYRICPLSHARIEIMDVRRSGAQITNQKLLTSDQITIALNLLADYEIADPALAAHSVDDHTRQLHEDVQLAARTLVGSMTVDALLEDRQGLNTRLLEQVAPIALQYGLRVFQVAIKDVMLAPRVRDMLMKEAEARRTAQAMLVNAREEVAAMRALSNAARMARENPALLRLRELDVARGFAQSGGNTVVMGLDASAALSLRGTPGEITEPPEESE